MDEDDSLEKLQEENRLLRRRVAEYEELIAGRERPAATETDLETARADVARLLKLLGQKDKILEAYATELERKSEKIRNTVDELRRKDEALGREAVAQRLLEVLVEGALSGAFLLVDTAGRVAFASAAMKDLLGEALQPPKDALRPPSGRAPPAPEAGPILRGVDARLADDLRQALEGTAGAPRAVTAGGKPFLASAAPLCVGTAVEGAVFRFVPGA